jgi:hypothetical protein
MGSASEAKPKPVQQVRRGEEESEGVYFPQAPDSEEGKGKVFIKYDERSGEVSDSARIKEGVKDFHPGSLGQETELIKIPFSNDANRNQHAIFCSSNLNQE